MSGTTREVGMMGTMMVLADTKYGNGWERLEKSVRWELGKYLVLGGFYSNRTLGTTREVSTMGTLAAAHRHHCHLCWERLEKSVRWEHSTTFCQAVCWERLEKSV